jgi:hypothetical protein
MSAMRVLILVAAITGSRAEVGHNAKDPPAPHMLTDRRSPALHRKHNPKSEQCW